MDERALVALIAAVKAGAVSRRRFVEAMVGVGLTAPLAVRMLTWGGVAHAQPRASAFTPTRRGGGGPLRLLYWAAPTILNPHLALAPKDLESSQISCRSLPARCRAPRTAAWRATARG